VRAKGRREASASGQQKTRPVLATAGRNYQDAIFIAYRTEGCRRTKTITPVMVKQRRLR